MQFHVLCGYIAIVIEVVASSQLTEVSTIFCQFFHPSPATDQSFIDDEYELFHISCDFWIFFHHNPTFSYHNPRFSHNCPAFHTFSCDNPRFSISTFSHAFHVSFAPAGVRRHTAEAFPPRAHWTLCVGSWALGWIRSTTRWPSEKRTSHLLKSLVDSENCELGMDQYPLIPFLGGWTSIYQLFWCELQGYKVLTHCQLFSWLITLVSRG